MTTGVAGGDTQVIRSAENPGSAPTHLTVAGDHVYFAADDSVHGSELWRCSASGVVEFVGDFTPGPMGSEPRSLCAVGDYLYFVGHLKSYVPQPIDIVWQVSTATKDARTLLLNRKVSCRTTAT